ncbi:MAG: universal stress protein [Gammaproteobacteria bacterium]|jgi:nucleotide-binding universal stress UspA family protein|nr:universal stress protein [Gammaproteobacteria bacterium]MBU0769839.1 universal stress protein [Gammaproteobacteria bacterium]MBU0856452.1 universal stress protein [Gammaproteobacteria bacterium]MBU1847487.1 universal stress protein [Gammaproteobacteria bacterium]
MYSKVLLAYDGSESGRRALLECADINNLLQAQIHLLAVAPIAATLFVAEGFVADVPQEEENERFAEVLREGLAQLKTRNVTAEGHLVTGDAVHEITRMARELAVDLIVIGHTHHTSRLERWWKGSVGASLVEEAPCSILVAVQHPS